MPAPVQWNCFIWTARTVLQGNGSFAAPAQTSFSPIRAHIAPDRNRQYTLDQDSNVVEQFFTARVDQNADVGIGDSILKITKSDQVTPYPPDVNTTGGRAPSVIWTVWNEHPAAPGRLSQRTLYLKRTWGGGPTTL